jgi:hypothetical protein
MSNGQNTPPDAGVVELVSGIITDVQMLIRQQVALLQHEIRGEVRRTREAGSLVAAGLAIAVVGSIFLCGMLVHLLARMVPGLPLWACYGIVGAPIATLGGVLCLVGIQRFSQVNTPIGEPVQDPKENVDG